MNSSYDTSTSMGDDVKMPVESMAFGELSSKSMKIIEISDKTLYSDLKNHGKNTFIGKLQEKLKKVIDNEYVLIIMTILTLWTLFSSDIRLATTTKTADLGFTVVISVIFFVFLIEILISCFCKPEYIQLPTWQEKPGETFFELWYHRLTFGSFYFWLDLIATLSLIFEIDYMVGTDYVRSNVATLTGTGLRTAARAGRILRLLRLFRFIRFSRLLKYLVIFKEHHQHPATVTKPTTVNTNAATETRDDDDEIGGQESHVGAKISELTTQRVIVLVITMLIIIPSLLLFDPDTTNFLATHMVHSLAVLNVTNSSAYSSGLQYMTDYVISTTSVIKIVNVYPTNGYNDVVYFDPIMNDLRYIEILQVIDNTGSPTVKTTMYFDERDYSVQTATYSIFETLFVIFVLLTATYFFSSDVTKLVITPIEYMVALVRKISDNPLRVEYKIAGAADGFHEGLETIILLSTITKIGGLMRVGFGEAGASVIAKNLAESSGGQLNLMGSGTLINSIFGFCDVRQFTDTTECLQEEVMLFVNRIAHILHGIVVQCSGQANKNIGDAFLLTWKIDENIAGTMEESILADQALLAFLKTLIELIRYESFICNFSPDATSRLYKRFPGYNVRIGCGLHYGWAIEGAIGSNRKIDASYLSPHVNFTEFLESSTKAYGVPLLMSEAFYKMLSPSANKYCRQVDCIKRADDETPIGLYTYDADLSIDFSDHTRRRHSILHQRRGSTTEKSKNGASAGKSFQGFSFRGKPTAAGLTRSSPSKNLRTMLGDEAVPQSSAGHGNNGSGVTKNAPTIVIHPYIPRVWDKDEDLIELRHKCTPQFKNAWSKSIDNYLSGKWELCMISLKDCLKMTKGSDGPSKFLLGFIEESGGKAPEGWKGYRGEDDGH